MHDMAYTRFGSGKERQSADAILATKARMRSHSGDATIEVSATVVAYGMLFKWMIGLKSMEMQQPTNTEEKNDLHKVRK